MGRFIGGQGNWEMVKGRVREKVLEGCIGYKPWGCRMVLGDVNLLKEDVGTIPVWVKPHGVPVTSFSEDGLSAIATKLGTPLMLDSYTSDMSMQSWGRCACCKFFIRVQEECPKNIGAGETKNLKKPSQTPKGFSVGQKKGFKPKQVYQPVLKKPTANTSRNKKKNMKPTKEVSKLNPFDVLTSVENDVNLGINEGTANLASQEANSSKSLFWNGKPLENVSYSGDYDSEDEVALVHNEMTSFLAKKDGYGTQSLLEQWKESYENGDYEYDPYDDDMYEGQDIP
ncbi:putative reverse transcriptase domain-containing protein [Tanacetum coccineum]